MKKTIIISALILFSQLVKAQFITDNMRWTEIETNIFDSNIKLISSYRIEGDTVINNLTYFKVYDHDNIFVATLREDTSNKVFSYNFHHGIERLLYDFKWEKGKELFYSWNIYDSALGNYPRIRYTIINEIDSVQLLDGLYYKCIKDGTPEGEINVIQGVGDMKGFFSVNRTSLRFDGSQYALLCFHKGEQLIYLNPDYDDCLENPSSISPLSLENSIKIYPNPVVDGRLIIEDSKSLLKERQPIMITDITGKIVMVSEISSKKELDVSSLVPGIYIIQIGDIKEKFVKQ